MSDRKIEDIDYMADESLEEVRDQSRDEELEPVPLVHLHYPEPTALTSVLEEVARWSEFNFVMDPKLNRPIQIFAPRKIDREEAFQLFVASLETIGLRALQMQGSVIKIVPMQFGGFGA